MRKTPVAVSSWIRENPVAGFIALAYGTSYSVGWAFLWAYSTFAPSLPPLLGVYFPRLFIVYGPAVAAITVCYVLGGWDYVRLLLIKLHPRAQDWPWWIGLPLLGGLSWLLALRLAGGSVDEAIQAISGEWLLLCGHFFLQIVVVGVGEEIGWRGWLLPALLRRTSAFKATLLVAAVWGLWHLPLLLSGLKTAAFFMVGIVALSVLLTRLWLRVEGNLFVVALAHASVNATGFFLEQVSDPAGPAAALLLEGWYGVEMLCAVAAVFVIACTWRSWFVPATPGVAPVSRGAVETH